MSLSATITELWGRILLHNKLLTPEQWSECVAAWRRRQGEDTIAKILLAKGYLDESHINTIQHKVLDLLEKHRAELEHHEGPPSADKVLSHAANTSKGAQASPAPSPASPPAPARSEAAPGPGDDDDELEELEELDELIDEAGQQEDDPADDGAFALNVDGDQIEAAPGHAGAVDWVDELRTQGHTEKSVEEPHHADVLQIDLDGDDEAYDQDHFEERLAKLKRQDYLPGERRDTYRQTLPGVKPADADASADASARTGPSPAARPAQHEVQEGDDGLRSELAYSEHPAVPPLTYDPLAVQVLRQAIGMKASDVHLSAGSPPFMRLHGQLTFFKLPAITPEQGHRIALGFMTADQQAEFLKRRDLDFSLEDPALGRFRVNALEQFRGASIIFRIIPQEPPTLEELGLPSTLERFTQYHQGLVLVTGSAGSGKSTTAAALVRLVNESRRDHVITIEDPVEMIHKPATCNVTQRQVPRDTASFATALRAALREDPDVIMIGEMRDLETVSLAIRAAETGHLVIGTLQTKSAARTIDRVVDVFPDEQQPQIRAMLSESLRGIISQQLIPKADGKGRIVAIEVLTVTNAVSNLIRDAKTFQLPSLMQTGRRQGQVMMDDSIQELLNRKLITLEAARKAAHDVKRFGPAPEAEPAAT